MGCTQLESRPYLIDREVAVLSRHQGLLTESLRRATVEDTADPVDKARRGEAGGVHVAPLLFQLRDPLSHIFALLIRVFTSRFDPESPTQ